MHVLLRVCSVESTVATMGFCHPSLLCFSCRGLVWMGPYCTALGRNSDFWESSTSLNTTLDLRLDWTLPYCTPDLHILKESGPSWCCIRCAARFRSHAELGMLYASCVSVGIGARGSHINKSLFNLVQKQKICKARTQRTENNNQSPRPCSSFLGCAGRGVC